MKLQESQVTIIIGTGIFMFGACLMLGPIVYNFVQEICKVRTASLSYGECNLNIATDHRLQKGAIGNSKTVYSPLEQTSSIQERGEHSKRYSNSIGDEVLNFSNNDVKDIQAQAKHWKKRSILLKGLSMLKRSIPKYNTMQSYISLAGIFFMVVGIAVLLKIANVTDRSPNEIVDSIKDEARASLRPLSMKYKKSQPMLENEQTIEEDPFNPLNPLPKIIVDPTGALHPAEPKAALKRRDLHANIETSIPSKAVCYTKEEWDIIVKVRDQFVEETGLNVTLKKPETFC